jgi:hypothetical protein
MPEHQGNVGLGPTGAQRGSKSPSSPEALPVHMPPFEGSRSTRTHHDAQLVHSQTVEENAGLRPPMRWMNIPDCVHVSRGISPMHKVCFLTSAVCLVCLTKARSVLQRA